MRDRKGPGLIGLINHFLLSLKLDCMYYFTCKHVTCCTKRFFCILLAGEKIVIIPPLNETFKAFEKNVVEALSPVTCASNKNGKCHYAKMRGRSISANHPDGLDLVFLFDASSSIKLDKFKLGLDFACHLIKQFGVDYR